MGKSYQWEIFTSCLNTGLFKLANNHRLATQGHLFWITTLHLESQTWVNANLPSCTIFARRYTARPLVPLLTMEIQLTTLNWKYCTAWWKHSWSASHWLIDSKAGCPRGGSTAPSSKTLVSACISAAALCGCIFNSRTATWLCCTRLCLSRKLLNYLRLLVQKGCMCGVSASGCGALAPLWVTDFSPIWVQCILLFFISCLRQLIPRFYHKAGYLYRRAWLTLVSKTSQSKMHYRNLNFQSIYFVSTKCCNFMWYGVELSGLCFHCSGWR